MGSSRLQIIINLKAWLIYQSGLFFKQNLNICLKKKKVFLFKYVLGSNNLTLLSNKRAPKEDWKKWANIAPDSTVVFYSKKFNLYWMDKENFLKTIRNEKDSTIVENQWTKDGVQHFGYGGYGRGMDNEEIEKRKNDKFPVRGYWLSLIHI